MKIILKTALVLLLGGAGYLYHLLMLEQENMDELLNQTARLEYLNKHLAANAFQFKSDSPSYIDYLQVTDAKGEEHQFYQLLDEGSKLVFRMGFDHCNLCYEAEIDRLKMAIPKLEDKSIVILSNFKKRDFLVMVNQYQYQLPSVSFYNHEGFLSLSQEDYAQPYYFVVESNGRTHSFFLPDKAVPQHTFKYFDSLLN